MFDYFYGHQSEQFTFYRIPKVLFIDSKFKKISIEAKPLYGRYNDVEFNGRYNDVEFMDAIMMLNLFDIL